MNLEMSIEDVRLMRRQIIVESETFDVWDRHTLTLGRVLAVGLDVFENNKIRVGETVMFLIGHMKSELALNGECHHLICERDVLINLGS